jgi:hypothetical protein
MIMEETTKNFIYGFGIASAIFIVLGMVGWGILSLGSVEIANNCFLAGQGYEVNSLCLEYATDPEIINGCTKNLEKSLAIAKENMCEPQ